MLIANNADSAEEPSALSGIVNPAWANAVRASV